VKVPRNIEIKARIDSIDAVLPRALAVADHPAQIIDQDDTFFAAAHGRLKLRVLGDGHSELIHYHRPDVGEAKASDYVRVPVADPQGLRQALQRAWGPVGPTGRVRKRRWLLMAGRTRIHLDRVEGLGDFMELEVVMQEGEDDLVGMQQAQDLMKALGLEAAPRIRGAYRDLLAELSGELPAELPGEHP
jgi:predicted adenylyl cyclase CyaB